MDLNRPFLFKWSLKRNAATDLESNKQLCDESSRGGINVFDWNGSNSQIPPGKEDFEFQTGEAKLLEKTAVQIQATSKERNTYLSSDRESQCPPRDDSPSIIAAKRPRLQGQRQNSDNNVMDVDTSSEKVALNEDYHADFEKKFDELKALEQKLCAWLSGQWLPSKEDALQMLSNSIIIRQRFQEIAKYTKASEDMRTILELAGMLVEKIKESISQCDACSLELMDYDTYSSEKGVLEKMNTGSSEVQVGINYELGWSLDTGNQEGYRLSSPTNQPEEEESSENSPLESVSGGVFPEAKKSLTSDTPHQEDLDPGARTRRVKAIRAILLPRVIQMLDNYDEWFKEHHNETMHEFLEMKHDETLQKRSSIDDTVDFVARGSAGEK